MERPKAFSLLEVSLHSSKSDCWLIIKGQVYDVTNFLEEHPGGEEILIEASAKGDATTAFEDVGHTSTAISMMSGYFIGVLDGSEGRNDVGVQQSSKIVKDERERESVAAKKTPEKPLSYDFNDLFDYLKPLIIIALAFGAWYFFNKVRSVVPI